jgi:hypothetical protein
VIKTSYHQHSKLLQVVLQFYKDPAPLNCAPSKIFISVIALKLLPKFKGEFANLPNYTQADMWRGGQRHDMAEVQRQ